MTCVCDLQRTQKAECEEKKEKSMVGEGKHIGSTFFFFSQQPLQMKVKKVGHIRTECGSYSTFN